MGTKIGTLKDRETGDDFLPRTDSSLVTGLEDLPTIRRLSNGALQYTLSGEAEPVNPAQYESTTNKTTSLDNESTNTEYPSAKAVVDALGKWGVVSQTQTWTQAADGGYDHTMSNQVRGLIPQSFIDDAVSAGATFNATTGYFEVNGLTDISYNEMHDLLAIRPLVITACAVGTITLQNYPKCPRTLPTLYRKTASISAYNFFRVNAQVGETTPLESVGISQDMPLIFTTFEQLFYGSPYLKRVYGVLKKTGTGGNFNLCFANCASLEDVSINGLDKNISIAQSGRLTLASVVYMVDNAANSSAITITLHATAYARCQADTTAYTYNGNTYTGILAYASAKNITIASA